MTLRVGMLTLGLGLAASGSSGCDQTETTTSSCTKGNERCPCFGNGTCNSGLVCRSDVCVKPGGVAGSSNVGGNTNAAGTNVGDVGGAATIGGTSSTLVTTAGRGETTNGEGGAASGSGGLSGSGGTDVGNAGRGPNIGGASTSGGLANVAGRVGTAGASNGGATPSGGSSSNGGATPSGGSSGASNGGNGGTSPIPGCGDGLPGALEACDDGNNLPFDGCSSDCQLEPNCSGGSCNTRCGDGIVLNEACDDGNRRDGDGCSSSCVVEANYTCGRVSALAPIRVPAIYRDFLFSHSDFEHSAATGRNTALLGMVDPLLDLEGKPVYVTTTGSFVSNKTSFAQWYRNVPLVNHATPSSLSLWPNTSGGYVNRHGANGEPFERIEELLYCGSVGYEKTDGEGKPIPCTTIYGKTDCDGLQLLSCYVSGTTYRATHVAAALDGTPLFFPVDGDGFTPTSERQRAMLPPPQYANDWVYESNGALHNFSFTTELRHRFVYDSTRPLTIEFAGDDDAWVFVNHRLALDVGGIHTPIQNKVAILASNAASYGLESGKIYEIVVFHAERMTSASSFLLSIQGADPTTSYCMPN